VKSPAPDTGLAERLRDILIDGRVHNPDAVLKLVDAYGYTVEGIYEALKDAGIFRSNMRYVLKRWASEMGQRIPLRIWKEIAGNDEFTPRKLPIYEDFESEELEELKHRLESKGFRVIPKGEDDSFEKSFMRELAKRAAEKLFSESPSNHPSTVSDDRLSRLESRIDELEKENARLREELTKKQQELTEKEIESLKAEIKNLKENQRAHSQFDIELKKLDLIDKRLDRFHKLILAMGRPPRFHVIEERETLPESGRYRGKEWVIEE